MPTYKTPGVYTEEISTLPPSVAEIATAIPAFIGYTEKAKDGDEDLLNKPARINSLLDYRAIFGGPPVTNFKVQLVTDDKGNREVETIEITDDLKPRFLMYYSLSLYFKNGGGPCYVVSVGNYTQTLEKKAFLTGLDELRKEDEPTLILLTDAVNLNPADYYELCQASLKQCSDLKDRFALFDILNNDNDGRGNIGASFRDSIVGDLKYGAAYYPYLQTSINHFYRDDSVSIYGFIDTLGELYLHGLRISYKGPQVATPPQAKIELGDVSEPKFAIDEDTNTLTITIKKEGESIERIVGAWKGSGLSGKFNIEKSTQIKAGTGGIVPLPLEQSGLKVTYKGKSDIPPQVEIKMSGRTIAFNIDIKTMTLTITIPQDGETIDRIVEEWKRWAGSKDKFDIEQSERTEKLTKGTDTLPLSYEEGDGDVFYLGHSAIEYDSTILYNQIKSELTKKRVILPPGPAVAGVYARVDRTRGVWNSPANEGLVAVIKPTVKITHSDQENLNIDTTAGKSINAIRSFVGKGTLIWGARTLAGNNNEWRYISVRRLSNMIEESIQKSTAWAVFGPNTAMTWLKVKAMIESYLEGLWRQGALVGSTPGQAFFVHVGLGVTMTQQDILEGRMIIEVGIAAVRPAEFIILKFSHKMQEA